MARVRDSADKLRTVSHGLFVLMSTVSSFGIAVAVALLAFNFYFRDQKSCVYHAHSGRVFPWLPLVSFGFRCFCRFLLFLLGSFIFQQVCAFSSLIFYTLLDSTWFSFRAIYFKNLKRVYKIPGIFVDSNLICWVFWIWFIFSNPKLHFWLIRFPIFVVWILWFLNGFQKYGYAFFHWILFSEILLNFAYYCSSRTGLLHQIKWCLHF